MVRRSIHLIIILLSAKVVRCLNDTDIQGEIIEDFKRLCPYTNMCLSTASKNLTEESDGLSPCCRRCNCDVNCGAACCPDRPERFLNNTEVDQLKNFPEQCLFAQIRKFDSRKLNGKSYRMIGKCPENYSNVNMKEKCSRHYYDFDFEKDDFKTLMPVSAETVNITFRNYYCAVCHNALNTKLHFWSTKSVCKNKKLPITKLSEIPSKLSEEPLCQVLFEPSFPVSNLAFKVCSGMIERCNVTGNWKVYDRSTEIACLSYTSQYNGFKNIHCFLCNGNTIKETSGVCLLTETQVDTDDTIFSQLDFYSMISSLIQKQDTNCPDATAVYDPYQDVCRNLFCATGLMLTGNKCIPQYPDNVYLNTSVVFNLRFKLIPSHIARRGDLRDLLIFMKFMSNDLMSKLDMIQTADDADICAINAYLKLDDSLEEIIMSMTRHNLTELVQFMSHISVSVDFSIKGIENISSVVEEMAMLYTSNRFHLQYRLQYLTNAWKMPTKHNNSLSNEYVRHLDDINLDASEYNMLLNGQNDPNDGQGIIWFQEVDFSRKARCDSAVSVQPNPFCPRTELYSQEYDIDDVNQKITSARHDDLLTSMKPYVTFTMMMKTGDDNSVIVCADEYFSQLHALNKENQTDYELKVLIIICLACSVLSLALTFVIYCILPELRTLPGLNIMSLVLHLFFQHTFIIISETADVKLSWLCSAIGIIIHYNLLAGFFWMFICTLHMLKVFVNIYVNKSCTHTKSIFIQYLVFAEMMSAILVACNIIVAIMSLNDSAEFGYGGSLCLPKHDLLMFCFLAAPLFLVLMVNLGMFIYVIWRVFSLPNMTDCSNKERHAVIIFAKLSSLTGIAWILDFFSYFTFMKYAFVIFTSGQGFFIMMSFVMNRRVLNMLRLRFKKPKHDTKGPSTISGFTSIVHGNEDFQKNG